MSLVDEPIGRHRAAPLALRYALRELRGGLRGFYVFIACIALGVMAIAGVGSVAASLSEGLAHEGRTLLGGDAAFSLMQREAKPGEVAFLRSHGEVSVAATLRAMARTGDGRLALVELKAVDGTYPMLGALTLDPTMPAAELLAVSETPGLITEGGLRTHALQDARGPQWTKVVFNSATSPLAALTGLSVGRVCTDAGLRQQVDELVAEALAVCEEIIRDCRAAGVPVVIENLVYERPGEDLRGRAREDAIIEAARALNDLDIDLLKLEYPGSPAGCRRLASVLDRLGR